MNLKSVILKLFIFFCIIQQVYANHPKKEPSLSLKQKIGQMLLIGFKGIELKPSDPIVKAILNQEIGGVILFDYDFTTKTYDHNIKNPIQLKTLITEIQEYAKKAAKTHHTPYYPLLISIDYEGGKVNRLKPTYGFPETISAAEFSQLSKNDAIKKAKQMAKTLSNLGVNLNFAPVVDVNINKENPVIGKLNRSFSDDPEKVTTYAAIVAKAYKDAGVFCTLKHFPGHGSSTGDTHLGFVDVTQTWQPQELTPYEQLFKQHACPFVMTAHVVNEKLDAKAYPASISKKITTDLLRQQLGFKGVVITDDLQMDAIKSQYSLSETVRLAINAGADILVFGNQLIKEEKPQDPSLIIDLVMKDIENNQITKEQIESAYQRIIHLKLQLIDKENHGKNKTNLATNSN